MRPGIDLLIVYYCRWTDVNDINLDIKKKSYHFFCFCDNMNHDNKMIT